MVKFDKTSACEGDSCGIACNQHKMSFQLICNLLEFERSIEVVKFDKTSVYI